MSVNISPISPRSRSVGSADDPFKKYWWGILAGFAATGLWLCIPVMETPVGSIHVDTAAKSAADAAGAEQNLDSSANPDGATGGALDLSMDIAPRKSKDGGDDMASMLYQASPDAGAAAAAAGKPLGDATAASASLAQQLKDAGKATGASGWNEKPQRGFASPQLSGGLSGIGSAGGGGSSASASESAGNAGLFGSQISQVGFARTKGLQDNGGADSPGVQALKAAAGKAAAPNLKGSAEAMHAGMSAAFDGAKGAPPARIGMGTGAMAQANAALDAAPANLKANDPKLDSKKLPDPPMAPTAQSSGQDMGKQLLMMAATAIIGGMIPGVGGQMVMMMGTMMMQQQQAADASKASAAATSNSTTHQNLGA